METYWANTGKERAVLVMGHLRIETLNCTHTALKEGAEGDWNVAITAVVYEQQGSYRSPVVLV